MDNLSEKIASVVIKYTDLDDNLAELANSGKLTGNVGEAVNYSTADKIKDLTGQGYILVNNPFDGDDKTPIFNDGQDSYMVTFKHGREVVTANNLKYGCKLEDLEVNKKQIIHYVGAGNRTPRDEVSTVTFNQVLVYDQVTGKKIGSKGWEEVEQSFPVVAAPSILGYVPDKVVVGGKAVTADDADQEYTVTYKVNEHLSTAEQKAEVKYLDIDSNNEEIVDSEILTGKPNTQIIYSTSDQLKDLDAKGYEVVNNGFDFNGDVQFFDTSDEFVQTFIVTLKHKQVLVNNDNSLEGIDESEYHKVTKRTISYVGAEDETPEDVVQIVTWDRDITVDAATKRVISDGRYSTDWKPNKTFYEPVSVPSVSGYHTRIKEIPKEKAKLANITEKVRFFKNGYVIPVDENNNRINELSKLQFITDKNDPTLVTLPNKTSKNAVYEPQELEMNSIDPSKNLEVEYSLKHKYVTINQEHSNPNVNPGYYRRTATAIAHYEGAGDKTPNDSIQTVHWNRSVTYDTVTNEVLEDGQYTTEWKADKEYFEAVDTPVVEGYTADISVVAKHEVTESDIFATITYQKNGSIIPVDESGKRIKNAKSISFINDPLDSTRVLTTEDVPEIEGYKKTQEAVLIKDSTKDIEVKYILKPRYVLVDSQHPYRTVKPHNYSIPVRETVHYMGAGDKTPQDKVQGARWERTLTVNDNNGQIITDGKFTTEWKVDKKEYESVVTPVVDGYHADQYHIDVREVEKENLDIQVSYQKNGCIVAVDSKGNEIKDAEKLVYITDPTDATKVLIEQPVPRLFNYMPEASSVIIKDPSHDTLVTYYTFAEINEMNSNQNLKANIQSIDNKSLDSNVVSLPIHGKRRKAVVTFVDLSNNAYQITSSDILSGNVGDKITDLYSTADQIKKLEKEGYEVVYNGFDSKGAVKYFTEDSGKISTFTVAVKKINKSDIVKESAVKLVDDNIEKTSEDSIKEKNADHKGLKHIFPWMK